MPVTATLATSAGKLFAGAIRQMPYPYGSGNNAGETRITLNEFPAEGGYKLGDTMAIVVVVQHKRAVLWLPPEAIRAIGGRTFVVIPSGSDEQRVDVKLGVQTQERVEITAGLAEGQSVIGP
jgi:multidrug efflux pump subunit AcrA (membrane-fusion protein)